jgi:hypothetical protein
MSSVIAKTEFEDHHRDTDDKERNDVRQVEGPAAESVGIRREENYVTEANGRARRGENEADPRFPLTTSDGFFRQYNPLNYRV